MNEEYILKIINDLIEKQKENKITPLSVQDTEVYKEVASSVKLILNKLYQQGEIGTYNSVNCQMITLNKKS